MINMVPALNPENKYLQTERETHYKSHLYVHVCGNSL